MAKLCVTSMFPVVRLQPGKHEESNSVLSVANPHRPLNQKYTKDALFQEKPKEGIGQVHDEQGACMQVPKGLRKKSIAGECQPPAGRVAWRMPGASSPPRPANNPTLPLELPGGGDAKRCSTKKQGDATSCIEPLCVVRRREQLMQQGR